MLLHPEVANRDCDVCQTWQFDETTGQIVEKPKGTPIKRYGHLPCRTPIGCHKGTPEAQKSLSPHNQLAYQHYRECRAVGHFPYDPIVRRNAAIIREVEDQVDRIRNMEFQSSMLQVGVVKGIR